MEEERIQKKKIKIAKRRALFSSVGCLALLGGTIAWYSLTSNSERFNSERIQHGQANPSVQIVDNSLESLLDKDNTYGNLPAIIYTTNGPIDTATFDFEKDFDFETDRYRIVRDEDNIFSRIIAWPGTLGRKLFFWDYDISRGLDEDNTKEVIAMLENDESISNITVRINHTGAWEDFGRLFFDENVKERNPALIRYTLGVLVSLGDEMWAELARGDYYNPLTQTTVLYSNVEAISAHEIGHHKDFQRFKTDWLYTLANAIPGGVLYKEARASLYAKDLLGPEQNYQFYRYLVPAFGIYVLGTYKSIKKIFKDKEG